MIDLDDGHYELHSLPQSDFSTTTERTSPLQPMVEVNDQLYYSCINGCLQLFDPNGSQQDLGTTAYKAAVVLPPPNNIAYRNKAVKNLNLFSNLTSSHTLQHGINKNFNTTPPTLAEFSTANTSTDIQSHVLSGSQISQAPMVCLREDSNHTTAFEFYGLDILFEEGGEY